MITITRIGKKVNSTEIQDYIKKIKSIKILDIKEEKEGNKDLVKRKEGRKLLAKKIGFTVALSEEGEMLDSIDFSKMIEKNPDITFIIGGTFGLSEEVKKGANILISLSRLTFTHEMALLILVEQIYRAERILEGHPYHKI